VLGRKYVFETKSTRLKRVVMSGIIATMVTLAFVITFIIYIPIYAKMQKGRAAGAFFQKSPDAIAVFTGDKGRISYAIDFLKKNPTSKLFISGVYASNSFETLLNKQANPQTMGEVSIDGMQIDLDYESKNTLDNVRETVTFLRSNPDLTNVLIISSDYHIMRVNLIISHLMKGPKPKIYFDSVPNSYSQWKEIRKLLKESVKIMRTFFILKVLREEIIFDD
jgi:uncharacterized SAM-binding protein YcdF (DUF218 family)